MAESDPAQEAAGLLTKCRALSQRVATFSNRLIGESDALAVEIKSLQQAIAGAEKAAKGKGAAQAEVLDQLRAARDVVQGLGPGGDLRRFCKPKNPMLLQLLLGNKVSLVTFRADQSIAMKEEYHSFRDRSALIMLAGPALLWLGMQRANVLQKQRADGHTFAPGLMTGVQAYLLWLSYFYLAMALRENVLMVNGSHIKSWWIRHHYFSAASALMMLGLPVYSPAVWTFCQYFMAWSVLQALVMMMQNHYQRRRMYTRIALGKNSAMDVVAGESSGGSGQLLLLYPLLFVLQTTQFGIGVGVTYHTYQSFLREEGWLDADAPGSDLRGERGVCLVGVSFTYMAVRNAMTTIETIMDKRKYSSRAKSRKSASGTKAQ